MTLAVPPPKQPTLPRLEPGDHLDQATFHERYAAMPPGTRAELIGGIVYTPSPLKEDHGDFHATVIGWLWTYKSQTPGIRLVDNATCILGTDSEPQPDASMTVLGGQTRVNKDAYLSGAPELVVEVASSSEAYDLFEKRRDYEKHGVGEYLVLLVRKMRVVWFAREEGQFVEMKDQGGVLRSRLLPGLWLEVNSIFRNDGATLLDVLRLGMATLQYREFVQQLAESAKG